MWWAWAVVAGNFCPFLEEFSDEAVGVLVRAAFPWRAAVLALAFGLFSAVFSVTHPHAVMGIHDVNDVLPIAILDAGALLWLVRGLVLQHNQDPPHDSMTASRRSSWPRGSAPTSC